MGISLLPGKVKDALREATVWLLLLGTLVGCTAPVAQADPMTSTAPPPPSATPTVTSTPTVTPTATPTPTSIPTIVIPMLTRVITPTPTYAPPALWNLPERVVPEPFGVEIHFTRTTKQELDHIAHTGVKWVRMDMFWHTVERELGTYDFSEYDALVASMEARDISIVFILDYGNPLYDQGFPPTSPGGQVAFARFAATAARRYRDRGIMWEIWNEPNLDHFWTPQANAEDYARLALRTALAIRQADPAAFVVAPALAGYEWAFWNTVGSMGLFNRLDAITVHSYGVHEPESILQPYLTLRALINRYSPAWKIPVLSGEWGFSTTQGGMSEGQQAQYLTRQWLFNLAHDINLNIWYDWHDDGADPHDPEHHFGIVRHDYTAKSSYRAARTLLTTLDGYRFLRRIPLERSSDYLLLFQREAQVAMALWTTSEAHTLILPLSVDDVAVVDMEGGVGTVASEGEGLAIGISRSPRYLLFRADQTGAAQLGGWRPYDTIQCFQQGKEAGVHIVFESYAAGPVFGALEVRAQGEARGTTPIVVPPMAEQHVRIPLDIEGLNGSVPAEVRLLPEGGAPALPLQSALIWLQVRGE